MRCPACSAELPPLSTFCLSCGLALRTEGLTVTGVGLAPAHMHSAQGEEGLPPGTLLAQRYRIDTLLGSGGMGRVYRALDLKLRQIVALKFLPQTNPSAWARFTAEVRLSRRVSHPNVCRVYDLGEADGQTFLSMEYIDGEDLASLLRRIGRLPPDKGVDIARKLCAGLAAAHACGVLHRDLKPANIMVDGRGKAVLMDFGLAAISDQVTGREIRDGTPAYMAPEQRAGREVSVQSDLYSLGLVLHELFTGKRFVAGSDPASRISGGLDLAVDRIVERCLDVDPRRRPRSALAVAAALPGGDPLAAALAAGETPSPELVAASGDTEGLSSRAIALLVVASLVFLGVAVWAGGRKNPLNRIGAEMPPDALVHRGRDIARSLGYSERPSDRAWALEALEEPAAWLVRQGHPLEQPDLSIRFWYRESRREMANFLFGPGILGRANYGNPPLSGSGSLRLRLDLQGRLRGFEAVPPQLDRSLPTQTEPDWNPLFTAAGLDPARFQRVEPEWVPPHSWNARAAWTGTWPGGDGFPVRIEAAAWRPRIVWFDIIWPWTTTSAPGTSTSSAFARGGTILFLGVIAVGGWFAWRNYQLGRGDAAGASRLAAFSLAAFLIRWAVLGDHYFSFTEAGLLALALAWALFNAAILWVSYFALEPFVRRQWPRVLVSWSRVLGGQWRDLVVGRDILIGLAAGLAIAATRSLIGLSGVDQTEIIPIPLYALLGGRYSLAPVAAAASGTLGSTLVFLLFLFAVRVLLRKDWLTVLVGPLVVLIPFSSTQVALATTVWTYLVGVVGAAIIVRFGVLTAVAGYFSQRLVANVSFASTPSIWHAGAGMVVVAVVILLVLATARLALGGRPILEPDQNDESLR